MELLIAGAKIKEVIKKEIEVLKEEDENKKDDYFFSNSNKIEHLEKILLYMDNHTIYKVDSEELDYYGL